MSTPLVFGQPVPRGALPRRIWVMHQVYGLSEGHKCGACVHFLRYRQSTTWFKCELTQQTGGAATDWRATWPACGKFEREPAAPPA